MIGLWSTGILLGSVWFLAFLIGMIYFHRYSLMGIFMIWGNGYLAYMSYSFLREELGGPIVEFKSEKPLSPELNEKLRSIWK